MEAWRLDMAQAVVGGVVLATGLLALAIGLGHPRQRFWPYFGGLCLAWLAIGLPAWCPGLGLTNDAQRLLSGVASALALLCAVLFLFRYVLWRHPVLEALLWTQCLLLPASLLAIGSEGMPQVLHGWSLLLGLELLLAMGWYLWLCWRFDRSEWPLMLGLALVTLALALVRLAAPLQLEWLPLAGTTLWRLGIPLLLLLLALRLAFRLGQAQAAGDGLRTTLETRAREQAAEMERSFAQMAEMRVEQVTQAERKRIAADLHDDLGAKLLTIVHTSDNDRISTLAREALEEMRLSVRGLTGKPVQLADALGDWRAEVMARLSQAGLEGEWKAPTEELKQTLSARTYVQTTRILREAVSNIIKHSGASQCKIRCRLLEKDFQLVIQDNGNGIPMELDGRLDRGHGMASMKHRAKQMHGQCLVESGPGFGTVIRLTLPL
jgi:two-component system, NarL family, sensor histidine kinase UhpB